MAAVRSFCVLRSLSATGKCFGWLVHDRYFHERTGNWENKLLLQGCLGASNLVATPPLRIMQCRGAQSERKTGFFEGSAYLSFNLLQVA